MLKNGTTQSRILGFLDLYFLNIFTWISTQIIWQKSKKKTFWKLSTFTDHTSSTYEDYSSDYCSETNFSETNNFSNLDSTTEDKSDLNNTNKNQNNPRYGSRQFRFGFCVLNFLSILSDFLSLEKLSQKKLSNFAKLQFSNDKIYS